MRIAKDIQKPFMDALKRACGQFKRLIELYLENWPLLQVHRLLLAIEGALHAINTKLFPTMLRNHIHTTLHTPLLQNSTDAKTAERLAEIDYQLPTYTSEELCAIAEELERIKNNCSENQ